MTRTRSTPLGPCLLVVLTACGSGADEGGGMDDLFPPQVFRDDFDSGQAAARWGCGSGACSWRVVSAGPLAPSTGTAAAAAPPPNFVFESPDPMGLDPDRWGSCVSFPAAFEQEGTFAFDYFVQTAGPVGFQDGNYLEVSVVSHTLGYDPDFGEIIVDSQRETVLEGYGNLSSRFHEILPPGHYDFEFCYLRWRTFEIGPDFVQIDNVETCTGTGCVGTPPAVPRCQVDEGQTLVPDAGAVPRHLLTVNRVQGSADRYYVIVDAALLDFVSGGLQTAGSGWDALRAEIDGVRDEFLVDGKTCDVDHRRSLLIEMSRAEVIDFVIATGAVEEAIESLEAALKEGALQLIADEIRERIRAKIQEWLFSLLIRLVR